MYLYQTICRLPNLKWMFHFISHLFKNPDYSPLITKWNHGFSLPLSSISCVSSKSLKHFFKFLQLTNGNKTVQDLDIRVQPNITISFHIIIWIPNGAKNVSGKNIPIAVRQGEGSSHNLQKLVATKIQRFPRIYRTIFRAVWQTS